MILLSDNDSTLSFISISVTLYCGPWVEQFRVSQSPRDRVLWILANNGGKMERSRLRARTGMRYALLNPILEELASESKIKITVGKQGDLISLIVR
jgi:hypothetical protein